MMEMMEVVEVMEVTKVVEVMEEIVWREDWTWCPRSLAPWWWWTV